MAGALVGPTVTETQQTISAVRVDAWADIVCPYCYIGEARLVAAADSIEAPVVIIPRAFQLDPERTTTEPVQAYLGRKFGSDADTLHAQHEQLAGMAEELGLPFVEDRTVSNTLDAHRLVAAAEDLGLVVRHAIQLGHFSGALDLSSPSDLADAAAAAGMDRDAALAVLASDEHADMVLAEQRQATELGATGVPFTVIGERFGIPGAAATEQYRDILTQAAAG
ncbi:DsbA family oxidoreductase [Demequina flava]|uniref:DsbA family oxidoreductase n=1 Tax=Demequina flava TaxID=1095025 RepID=UPI0007842A8D|nr:DsbA family protein [Demequina flava]